MSPCYQESEWNSFARASQRATACLRRRLRSYLASQSSSALGFRKARISEPLRIVKSFGRNNSCMGGRSCLNKESVLKSESKSCIAHTFASRRGQEGSNLSLFLPRLHPCPWECMGL